MHSNVAGMVNIMEEIIRTSPMPKVVFASSSSVYGLNTKVGAWMNPRRRSGRSPVDPTRGLNESSRAPGDLTPQPSVETLKKKWKEIFWVSFRRVAPPRISEQASVPLRRGSLQRIRRH